MSTKDSGKLGEDLAVKFLRKNRFKILKRNFTSKIGEIDILARQRKDIVLVEVKAKTGSAFGEGYEMVNYFKKKKLLQLAKTLQTKYPNRVIRIDVVSVDLSQNPPEIKHFKSAVEDD
jgi:putative endonuclease